MNGRTYATVRDTPAKGLDKILAWARSWGVPDVWPMGSPTWEANRSEHTWETEGGHYGHGQTPENKHTDPGPMPKWPGATTVPKPGPPAFPGRSAFGPGKSNASILPSGRAPRSVQLLRRYASIDLQGVQIRSQIPEINSR